AVSWRFPRPGGGGPFSDSAVIPPSTDRQITFDISAEGPYRLFGREHTLVVGFNRWTRSREDDGFMTDFSTLPVFQDFNYWGWDGNPSRYLAYKTGFQDWSDYAKMKGGYFATRLSLAEPLSVLLGARLTDWETWTYLHNGFNG